MRTLWLVLGLGGCVVGGGERDWVFGGVDAVIVSVGSGEVTVTSDTDRDDVFVAWEGGGIGADNANPDVSLEDGTLVVDADGGIAGGSELEVHTPAGVDIEVLVARGEATIELVAPADIYACVAAGEVSIGVPAGAYDIELDGAVGELSATGLTDDPASGWSIHGCVATGEVSLYALP